MTTPTRARRATLDSVCAEAVELAREAAEESARGEVGEHLGCEAEDDRVVNHRFACRNPAYLGWHWAVTVSRALRSRVPTVCETVLLPGETAVLAPAWLPWDERLRPGDLGPGDILPPAEDDDRLLPGWAADVAEPFDPREAEEIWMVAAEAGLGRPRVMSPIGRDDATDRWYGGDRGPLAVIAMAASDHCSTCGFLLPMAGSVGRVFGVCGNEYAPDDGRVVSMDHGCGAHSEVVAAAAALSERSAPVLDEIAFDVIVGEDGDVELVLLDEPAGLDLGAHDPGPVDEIVDSVMFDEDEDLLQ
ncbi:MAG TPA: DUF3027 domain-containing protein [Sporichthyaceae bacterium]|nr:DUF3027 domain-containing protein [Sporichthyaceae bacterium]